MRTCLQRRRLLATICIALTVPAIAGAQQKARETHAVTLIELAPPHGKAAMVFRRSAGADRDVIALSPDAVAADLGTALQVLDVLREQFGDEVERDVAAAVKSKTASLRSGDQGKQDNAFVQQLRKSPTREVAGFGSVKALQIEVPKRVSKAKYGLKPRS